MEHIAEVELLGHKGKITHINTQLADDLWHKEDRLVVWLDFHDAPFDGIIGFAVDLPVKHYSKEELLKAVVVLGEPQLTNTLEKYRKQRDKLRGQRERKEALDKLAKAVEAQFR